ncbi:hypothetical protein KI387_001626, partial [Taxus chinensis]
MAKKSPMKRFWNGGIASPLPLPQAGLNVRRRLAFEDRDVALENLPPPSSPQPQCMMSRCHRILTPSLCRLGLITCIDARPNCPRPRPNRPRPNRLHRRPRPRPGSRPRPRPFPFPFPGEGIPGGGTADLERKFWFVWLTLFLLLNSSSTVIGEQFHLKFANGLIVRLKVLLTMAALILSSQVPWEFRTSATTIAEVGHAWATALAAPGSGAQAGAPPLLPAQKIGTLRFGEKEGCEVAAMALK